ncbi:16S rRNA (guanine(966)-N(2))-methyltransferase RsmD [Sphingomonas koreensis]|jgi:16S rRNA (guanine966-N2)-methyltransferase|uniref:16S rRNA (Guanine(966)-N(2))-methyltransferase RsmD n=1 Tax=Sphingomonas koreensis TaxID=93064 RepID=A0A1L6JC41_9SPHN|nr:16S rRNA (guanine(966)-N(2))-methyltransferase RsmD [Sphingomonas koreensis]APR53498.1 16S rRNA (guanine(966)-N(2))-methyltransferase RsmD [Sphingomonas koreensis]MDC7809796.1 16S rRNA (guanine(966)-N(2))-methyltransferase RsmD [Sphingomonas koreensis]RSU19578.1 16S rRNA (guanine(966)-N(2))-methyltransferase RsmD [Sphingomonas koreensis]RSU21047.1 16S rRNA (guanine(966)-N(2))-methyltransferase RsmD [Sphingomonas koreensis]RSU24374.1 16S rRNA (guanine(966)-N(2))-methyltransferase RsmD [Sphin
MRIIAGQWRGRPLAAPKGDATRPTADRTREALFSMLASRVGSFEDLAVADLFAGSGALGFEALSRGAASCLFVEQDRAALDALRANAEKLGVRADIRATSVLALGPAPKPLDVILMDPPYGTGAGSVALDKLARLGWTGPATWISIETAKNEAIEVAGFEVDAERVHGKAKLTILRSA